MERKKEHYTCKICGNTGRAKEMILDRDLGIICSVRCYEEAELNAMYDTIDMRNARDRFNQRQSITN
jgi:hypothetical protein